MRNSSIQSATVIYKQVPTPSKRIPAAAAKAHLRTLDHLYSQLQDKRISFRALPIDQLGTIRDTDLVITVGGDGTVLATSHHVANRPILGIKSFGQTSVGFFCAATIDNMALLLEKIITHKIKPRQFARLSAQIDGHKLEELILNDALFAHGSPAAITDYKIHVGNQSEIQRSSGIWVSTAAGSTAAIHGAGGKVMPLGSKRMQYRVREPFAPRSPYKLLGSIIEPNAVIKIESYSQHGTFSIDGAHIQYPAPEGSIITIRQAAEPLKIYWNS